VITRADVDAAAERIAGRVRVTPVAEVEAGAVWFKLELLQHTGTFKARGAFNRVLAAREAGELDERVGIVVASGGNAGLANAYAAAAVGVPATVFVPVTSPAVKLARLRGYGATVVQVGDEYAEAYEAALEHATRSGAVLVHAYDQPEVAAGAGV
jgi:threonine dehydratase